MKVDIDNESYITLKENLNENIVSMTIKASKEPNGYILMSIDLNSHSLDQLISGLVSVRSKIDSRV